VSRPRALGTGGTLRQMSVSLGSNRSRGEHENPWQPGSLMHTERYQVIPSSSQIVKQTIYTHTGWRRLDAGWCYLLIFGATCLAPRNAPANSFIAVFHHLLDLRLDIDRDREAPRSRIVGRNPFEFHPSTRILRPDISAVLNSSERANKLARRELVSQIIRHAACVRRTPSARCRRCSQFARR